MLPPLASGTDELGIAPEDVDVLHGDTDNTPYGLGTYGSRSTPVSGAATALVARKVRDKARLVASAMLEVSAADLDWERGRWFVRGDPEQGASISEIAQAARGSVELPAGVESGLDSESVYDPRCTAGSPTAADVPEWETDYTVTPSPHHPLGAKGIGESATVGSPPAIVNAVCDALAPYGVRHMDMPCTPTRVWDAMQGKAVPPQ